MLRDQLTAGPANYSRGVGFKGCRGNPLYFRSLRSLESLTVPFELQSGSIGRKPLDLSFTESRIIVPSTLTFPVYRVLYLDISGIRSNGLVATLLWNRCSNVSFSRLEQRFLWKYLFPLEKMVKPLVVVSVVCWMFVVVSIVHWMFVVVSVELLRLGFRRALIPLMFLILKYSNYTLINPWLRIRCTIGVHSKMLSTMIAVVLA